MQQLPVLTKANVGAALAALVLILGLFHINISDAAPAIAEALTGTSNGNVALLALLLFVYGHFQTRGQLADALQQIESLSGALNESASSASSAATLSLPILQGGKQVGTFNPNGPASLAKSSVSAAALLVVLASLGLSGCVGVDAPAATAGGLGITAQKIDTGLQTAGVIGQDLLTDLVHGAATYVDVQTALHAAQQTMGGHGVSVSNIGNYAQAEASAANTSGLSTAAQQLQTDITNQLAQGVTPAQITNQLTAAQTQLPTQPAPAATTNTSNP